HEGENSVLGVVSQTMPRVKPAGQEAMPAGRRSSEIKHVKKATGFEDAPDLTQCLLLLVLLEVVEHEGGEYSIEGRIGIRKLIGKPLIELDRDRRSFRLASCSCKRLRIRIESNNVDVRMEALDQRDQAAGAATDVENAMTWPKGRLIEQCPPGCIATQQLHEWVVRRQEPVVACRRDIGPRRLQF